MSGRSPLKVVLCWHMHQPNYLDPVTGEYKLPWTYLHAIKDYVDMAAHLEAVPQARAVVNFAPILLEQIDDYAQQVSAFLKHKSSLRDPLLAALASAALPAEAAERSTLIRHCLRVNRQTVVHRNVDFRRLAELADHMLARPDELAYLNDQFLIDLLVWYHLGWLGETVRRQDARVQALVAKGHNFTMHDRHELVVLIGELLNSVIPRYRKLAESGQVELSFTPYAHPIVPLLLDIRTTFDAMPNATMPLLQAYPGGEARARWHVQKGLETFEHYFGFRPQGCWPSEGSVSDATLALLSEEGVQWAASGENVLRNSLARHNLYGELGERQCIHRPYRVADGDIHCFFRDDGLSDLIGFHYSKWKADDAVSDLIHHLGNIANNCCADDSCCCLSDTIVPIILDGENAWEYYPENGYHFLSQLYSRLAAHPEIELTTFSACLENGAKGFSLPGVVAGSWVYGTFSTWIGDPDKNRAWDMLGEAKRVYDSVIDSFDAEAQRDLQRQLAICEGSDWFWWFGDYNPSDAVSDFERLYRLQLSTLYQMMEQEAPEYLSHTFTHGGGNPAAGGTMRQGSGG